MKVLATAAAISALAVAGCGSSSDSGGGGGSGGSGGGGGGGGGGKKLKIAILLPGSASDQGYNADGKRTAEALKKDLGAEVTFTEAVQIPNQTEVYRQYASQGNDLVIGWGTQFTEGAVAAAKEFPKVKFLVINATAKNGTNLASMDTKIEQWQFFAGYVAAKMSKNGVVGFVGGQCFPATAANEHGSEAGAKYANPKVKFIGQFTGDFEDPTKAKTTASAIIDQGATALTGNVNNGWAGIYDAAKSKGNIPIVTEWADNHTQAPEVIASSVLKSQSKFIVQIAKTVQDGTFKGEMTLFPLPKDWGPVIAKTDLLPDKIYKEALALQDKVVSGEIQVKRDETCPK
jgi:basic membrane lipoprotein Med (substrate-binding protein (PBP1-ABC) superfamily)